MFLQQLTMRGGGLDLSLVISDFDVYLGVCNLVLQLVPENFSLS